MSGEAAFSRYISIALADDLACRESAKVVAKWACEQGCEPFAGGPQFVSTAVEFKQLLIGLRGVVDDRDLLHIETHGFRPSKRDPEWSFLFAGRGWLEPVTSKLDDRPLNLGLRPRLAIMGPCHVGTDAGQRALSHLFAPGVWALSRPGLATVWQAQHRVIPTLEAIRVHGLPADGERPGETIRAALGVAYAPWFLRQVETGPEQQ